MRHSSPELILDGIVGVARCRLDLVPNRRAPPPQSRFDHASPGVSNMDNMYDMVKVRNV